MCDTALRFTWQRCHLIHVWHATSICVRDNIHICVCDNIHICDNGIRLTWHATFICRIHMCVWSHSYMCIRTYSYMQQRYSPNVTTHPTHVWHATIMCVWHATIICVCDIIQICVCDMIHKCNKEIRLTWQRIRCAQQNPMTHPSFQYVGCGWEKKRRKKNYPKPRSHLVRFAKSHETPFLSICGLLQKKSENMKNH